GGAARTRLYRLSIEPVVARRPTTKAMRIAPEIQRALLIKSRTTSPDYPQGLRCVEQRLAPTSPAGSTFAHHQSKAEAKSLWARDRSPCLDAASRNPTERALDWRRERLSPVELRPDNRERSMLDKRQRSSRRLSPSGAGATNSPFQAVALRERLSRHRNDRRRLGLWQQ